ncbi:hypothetical protein Tco_1223168, partial [Tanacetum coccineum]
GHDGGVGCSRWWCMSYGGCDDVAVMVMVSDGVRQGGYGGEGVAVRGVAAWCDGEAVVVGGEDHDGGDDGDVRWIIGEAGERSDAARGTAEARLRGGSPRRKRFFRWPESLAAPEFVREEKGGEFVNEPIVSEPTIKKHVVETSKAKASVDNPKVDRKNNGAPIIKDWVSDSEE